MRALTASMCRLKMVNRGFRMICVGEGLHLPKLAVVVAWRGGR